MKIIQAKSLKVCPKNLPFRVNLMWTWKGKFLLSTRKVTVNLFLKNAEEISVFLQLNQRLIPNLLSLNYTPKHQLLTYMALQRQYLQNYF